MPTRPRHKHHFRWARFDEQARRDLAYDLIGKRVRVHIVHHATFSDGSTVQDYWEEGVIDGLGLFTGGGALLCFYAHDEPAAPYADWPAHEWRWDLITEIEVVV